MFVHSVIDCHLAWCGRCDSLEQNYRALVMKYDSDQKNMEFLSCSEEFVPEEVKANLKEGPLRCKPRFLVYLEGNKKDEISGADYTKLEASVQKYIPASDD